MLERMPLDLKRKILLELPGKDIVTLSETSEKMLSLLASEKMEMVWIQKLKEDFDIDYAKLKHRKTKQPAKPTKQPTEGVTKPSPERLTKREKNLLSPYNTYMTWYNVNKQKMTGYVIANSEGGIVSDIFMNKESAVRQLVTILLENDYNQIHNEEKERRLYNNYYSQVISGDLDFGEFDIKYLTIEISPKVDDPLERRFIQDREKLFRDVFKDFKDEAKNKKNDVVVTKKSPSKITTKTVIPRKVIKPLSEDFEKFNRIISSLVDIYDDEYGFEESLTEMQRYDLNNRQIEIIRKYIVDNFYRNNGDEQEEQEDEEQE
jgi:hypothetical protein